MAKWQVEVFWQTEVEAEDEGDALSAADNEFSFYREANAEEISDYEDEEE